MIPKKLFLVWFGEEVPDYFHFSLNAFRKVNKTFECTLLHFTPEIFLKEMNRGIVKSSLINLKEVYNGVKDNYFFERFNKRIKILRKNGFNIRWTITFSEMFRVMLINHVGGIYLDGDFFPVKPFDDKLLNEKCFINNIDGYLLDENFIGGEPKFLELYDSYSDFKNKNKNSKVNFMHGREYSLKKPKYNELREKFFNKTLKYGERFMHPSLSYVDHYYEGRWLDPKAENKIEKIIEEFIKSK